MRALQCCQIVTASNIFLLVGQRVVQLLYDGLQLNYIKLLDFNTYLVFHEKCYIFV